MGDWNLKYQQMSWFQKYTFKQIDKEINVNFTAGAGKILPGKHLVVPESKEVLTKGWRHIKRAKELS